MEVEKTIYHHRGEQETGWSFWENYRAVEINKGQKGAGESNWEDNLQEIFSFNNLKDLGNFWYNCGYDDSSNLLYSTIDDTHKNVKRKGKLYTIDGVGLFREGIKPAWEDPQNAKGYELRCEVDVNTDKQGNAEKAYKQLWQNLVFGLIGEDFDYSEHICGFRYKYQSNKTALRVEVWIKTPLPDHLEKKGPEKTLERPQTIDQMTDDNSRIYMGIKLWLEDKIKTIRGNVPNVTFHTHVTSH